MAKSEQSQAKSASFALWPQFRTFLTNQAITQKKAEWLVRWGQRFANEGRGQFSTLLAGNSWCPLLKSSMRLVKNKCSLTSKVNEVFKCLCFLNPAILPGSMAHYENANNSRRAGHDSGRLALCSIPRKNAGLVKTTHGNGARSFAGYGPRGHGWWFSPLFSHSEDRLVLVSR